MQAEVPAGWTWTAPNWTIVAGDCPRDKEGWSYGKDSSFDPLLVDLASGLRSVFCFFGFLLVYDELALSVGKTIHGGRIGRSITHRETAWYTSRINNLA